MKATILALSLAMLATGTVSRPVNASPLDRDSLACDLARTFPTDANIEACTGEPIELPYDGPRFALLATAYTSHGPVVRLLANWIDGPTCTDNLAHGIAPYAGSILDGSILPARPVTVSDDAEPAAMILSCELAW